MKLFIQKSLIFILLFIILSALLHYGLQYTMTQQPILKNHLKGINWDQIYSQPSNSIDLVFVGSSRSINHFNPEIFDKHLKLSSYHVGMGEQNPMTSYYVLNELLKHQNPKLVIFEAFWGVFHSNTHHGYISYNCLNMNLSFNKIKYLVDSGNFFKTAYLLSPWPKDKEILFILFKNMLHPIKDAKNLKGYEPQSGRLAKSQDDFIKFLYKDYQFDPKKSDPISLAFVEKIIQLCKSKSIKLIFVTSPIAKPTLDTFKNYHEIHEMIATITQKNNIPYIDYNTLKDPKVNFDPQTDFYDVTHLNQEGAAKLSIDLSQRLNAVLNQ